MCSLYDKVTLLHQYGALEIPSIQDQIIQELQQADFYTEHDGIIYTILRKLENNQKLNNEDLNRLDIVAKQLSCITNQSKGTALNNQIKHVKNKVRKVAKYDTQSFWLWCVYMIIVCGGTAMAPFLLGALFVGMYHNILIFASLALASTTGTTTGFIYLEQRRREDYRKSIQTDLKRVVTSILDEHQKIVDIRYILREIAL